jgi:talin
MSKRVARVHFVDESCRAFAIDENLSVEQLRSIVVEKIGLVEDGCFALFEKRDDWERCLDSDERPTELMDEWQKLEKKKEGPADPKLLFKKKIFLRDDDREMKDSQAKHLLYIQALHSVIESEYPCSIDEALQLAGLQVHVTYGDHNPNTHVVGFLNNNLKDFVPKQLMPMKRPSEWEGLIFKQHAKCKGKTKEGAQTEYLDIVKQWPFYGTTFYPPCKAIGNRKIPNKVIIGVNAEGILLLKPKDKELISTHPFTEICSWASSANTFAFEFGSQNESQKYTFETKQGAIIAASIQTYIDILVQMLKNGESEDDDSTNVE